VIQGGKGITTKKGGPPGASVDKSSVLERYRFKRAILGKGSVNSTREREIRRTAEEDLGGAPGARKGVEKRLRRGEGKGLLAQQCGKRLAHVPQQTLVSSWSGPHFAKKEGDKGPRDSGIRWHCLRERTGQTMISNDPTPRFVRKRRGALREWHGEAPDSQAMRSGRGPHRDLRERHIEKKGPTERKNVKSRKGTDLPSPKGVAAGETRE